MASTTVTGTYLKPNDDPASGRVTFRLVAETYHDGLAAIFPRVPVTAVLDEDGSFTVELEPTSGVDAEFDATDMTYEVTERINGTTRDAYYVDIPTSGAVDLGTLATYADPPAVARVLVDVDSDALGIPLLISEALEDYSTTTVSDATYERLGRAGVPELLDEMSGHSDGSLNGVTPARGSAWVTTGAAAPTVTSGKLNSTATAGYAVQTLASSDNQIILAEVTFSGSTPGTNTMTLASAKQNGANLTDDLVHFNYGPAGFTFTVRRDFGTFDVISDGHWTQPCAQDSATKYQFGLVVSGCTATLLGPNGEVISFTDPRIGDARGRYVYWQPTTQAGPNAAYLIAAGAWSGAATGGFGLADLLTRLGEFTQLNYRRVAGSRGLAGEVSIGRVSTPDMPGLMIGPETIFTTLAASCAVGAGSLSVNTRIPAGSSIKLNAGTSSETVTASAAAATGTGPYARALTATTTGGYAAGTAVIATPTATSRTYMYLNTETGYFYLPDKFVICAPQGALYLGSSLDTLIQRIGANMAGMAAGDSFYLDGTYNGGHLQLGSYHLWVDGSGNLRIKSSLPASASDGTVVGTQT